MPTRFRHAQSTLVALLSGITLGAFMMLAVEGAVFTQAPTTVIDPDEPNRYTVVGDMLEMRYKFIRSRQCNSVSTTWIWQWRDIPDTEEKQRVFIPVNSSPVTLADVSAVVQDYVIAVTLPPNLKPGQWYVRTKFLDYCRLMSVMLGPTVRVSRDVPVTVP